MMFRISDLDSKGELKLLVCKLCQGKFTERQLIHHKTMCKRKRIYQKN